MDLNDLNYAKNQKTTQQTLNEEQMNVIISMMGEGETRINAPRIDADENILNPSVIGELANGGIVGEQSQEIEIKLDDCKGEGVTTVEFTIPLDFYKDIKIYFLKECMDANSIQENTVYEAIPKQSSQIIEDKYKKFQYNRIILWIIILFLIYCFVKTIFSLAIKRESIYKAAPGLECFITSLCYLGIFSCTKFGQKLNEIKMREYGNNLDQSVVSENISIKHETDSLLKEKGKENNYGSLV